MCLRSVVDFRHLHRLRCNGEMAIVVHLRVAGGHLIRLLTGNGTSDGLAFDEFGFVTIYIDYFRGITLV